MIRNFPIPELQFKTSNYGRSGRNDNTKHHSRGATNTIARETSNGIPRI